MWCTYLITRDDNKRYVGKTSLERIKKRMNCHNRDKIFIGHKFEYDILSLSEDHDEILEHETHFVKIFNTYNNGLNKTSDGKGYGHSSPKFTTLGRVFSDSHRKNMRDNHWSKTGKYVPVGRPHTTETIRIISEKKKGKVSWTKSNEKIIRSMIELYFSRPYIKDAGKIMKNGKILSYEMAFSKQFDKTFNLSNTSIRNILKGKVEIWRPILLEISEKYKS